MNYFFRMAFVILCLGSFSMMTSCGDSNDCSNVNDWIGTYSIIGDTLCSTNPDFFIADEFIIEPSEVAETFEYEDEAFTIVECTATDGFFTIVKDGNKINVALNSTGCNWDFQK